MAPPPAHGQPMGCRHSGVCPARGRGWGLRGGSRGLEWGRSRGRSGGPGAGLPGGPPAPAAGAARPGWETEGRRVPRGCGWHGRGRRRRAWAGDAAAPRRGQRAAGAEAAASARPGAASLGAFARRTGRRRTRPQVPGCGWARARFHGPGLRTQGPRAAADGGGARAGGACAGPGARAEGARCGWCGGTSAQGPPPAPPPSWHGGLPGAPASAAVAGGCVEVEAGTSETGPLVVSREGRPTRRDVGRALPTARSSLGVTDRGAFPESPGVPRG